jgi:hypothetical protein
MCYTRLSGKTRELKQKLSSPRAPAVYHLKDNARIIPESTRVMIRDLLGIGTAEARVTETIKIVGEGLGVVVEGNVSATSVGRIGSEGGVAAEMQIVHEVNQSNGMSSCYCLRLET